MPNLPSGTVTLLFSDIAGSTRAIRELAEDYGPALAEHRRIVRRAVVGHHGVEVDTQGDAFFVVFASADDALAAAAEIQCELVPTQLQVRIGIHTGDPTPTGEGYVGLEVHKAARIAATGHGGQVVLSTETKRHLVDLPELLDLGEHRLKDFDEPVHLLQLGDASFPPLRTISNTNLPRPVSSFVGRQEDVLRLVTLVRDRRRLITLTGAGGSGKTRLAIEAATEVVQEFRAGVFWVALAQVREPALAVETIARTLGAKGDLAAHVGEREMLLLLDNLEQVIDAAPAVADLAERCPNLHVLATSRELLRVRGEVEYAVEPLAPADAVDLFCTRARVDPDANVDVLCAAVDRLPLALELAAGRASVLSPAEMVERLPQRLDLFSGGRDAETRQRTLRATIDWSHELLGPDEQKLFARLSVFSGGCTVPAAEHVAAAELDALHGLIEKSMVKRTDDRVWMLETLREFASERLPAEATAELRNRHAEHYLALVEDADRLFDEADRQTEAFDLIERDYSNARAALGWLLQSGAHASALRMAAALRRFWYGRGYLSEGRRWLAAVLSGPEVRSASYARVLFGAALLATMQADWPEAKRLSNESHALGLDLGERRIAAEALLTLGRATIADGDHDAACSIFERASILARAADAGFVVAMASFNLGYAALSVGDYERARREFEAARDAHVAQRSPDGIARSLTALGSVAVHEGRLDDAVACLREALTLSRALGDRECAAWGIELLGVALAGSKAEAAARLLAVADQSRESLGLSLEGPELALHESAVASLRSALSDAQLERIWAAARGLPLERVLDEALS